MKTVAERRGPLLALLWMCQFGGSLGQECTSDPSKDCLATKCCTGGLTCYQKDVTGYWAGCMSSCTPGINPNDPPQYQTPWTCKVLSKSGPAPPPPPVSEFTPPPVRRRRRFPEVGKAPTGSVVARHGQLKTKGNRIVDQNDKPVRLRGMSLFWSQWKGQFYTADVVKWLAKDWKATVIRAAMAVDTAGTGYKYSPKVEQKKVEDVVDAAIEVGIYVIIDWHSHHAEKEVDLSKTFFNAMAEKYGHYPNVLFETFNEPEKQGWPDTIKPYHEEIIPIIRTHTENIIICGTRTWSQEVNVASVKQVEGSNIAYTLHFYASSSDHQIPLRSKAKIALQNGIPLFVTEWGTCEYTGNGKVDLKETQKWLDYLDENFISDANWAIGDKDEACAALKPGASGNGGWKENELTVSGKFMRDSIRKAAGGTEDGEDRRRRFSAPRRRAPPRRRSDRRRRGTPRRRSNRRRSPSRRRRGSRRRSPRRRSSSRRRR